MKFSVKGTEFWPRLETVWTYHFIWMPRYHFSYISV